MNLLFKHNTLINEQFHRGYRREITCQHRGSMAVENVYLRDLKDGYFVVKKFVINNILMHPKSSALQPAGDLDIMVTLDNRGSYLILTDNFRQVFNDYKDEYETKDQLFDNPVIHSFMEKVVYPDSQRVFIGFYSPMTEYGGCYNVPDICMQYKFNHLMAVEILDEKTLGSRFGWIKGLWRTIW